jgi:hypothetical protein
MSMSVEGSANLKLITGFRYQESVANEDFGQMRHDLLESRSGSPRLPEDAIDPHTIGSLS